MRRAAAVLIALALAAPVRADALSFNRDVRPILSDACFTCHGPDKAKRKGGLRLDTEAGVKHAFAGGVAKSPAWKRLTSHNAREQMPPPKAARRPSKPELAVLKRWAEQGAKWEKHWAFLAPKRPALPAVRDALWSSNPLDAFVLARLEKDGLRPSPEADRPTLIRRATLDLTGLPPTPDEVGAFVNDTRPGAYERVIDRLLASPRYGERLAVRWLDAARYADTSGYQTDGERVMWRWRDGVIDSYNANLPFDQFTREQLAGDLIPGRTMDQLIASGFNRNHRGNAEGGIIPEEYAVEYVADRAETTATVWLGLTMTCARCHDHKYDPLAQKEFYGLFAFFNNVPERGKAIKLGNSPPYALTPTGRQREKLAALDGRLKATRETVAKGEQALSEGQSRWEKSLKSAPAVALPGDGLVWHLPGEAKLPRVERDIGAFGFLDRFSVAARVRPTDNGGTLLSRMVDEPEAEGYQVALVGGRVQVNLVKRWLDDAIRVETVERLTPGQWRHVVVTYDGSRLAAGVKVYLAGKPARLRVLLDDLNQTFATNEPFRVGAGGGAKFAGRLADVRVYDRALTAEQAAIAAVARPVEELARVPAAKRTPAEAGKLRLHYLARHAPEADRAARRAVDALARQRQTMLDGFPTTMVMEEMAQPRATFVLTRGQYDQPGEKVSPGVPAALAAWPPGVKRDRLGLVTWLVEDGNPLTARVAVNRLWQMLFGEGLVRTVDDFGAQGEPPTHPELLDWLAVEFRDSGWDVKRLVRLIVTSATYRQSSRLTAGMRARDPDNRLLGRAPRLRLPAEMIRDQALAASGLLVEQVGGPSVKPYQPAGLWQELADTQYQRDSGPSLYRRGVYTFWKRTVAPPGLVTFDAAGREACSVRESRTNTPLQALNLLNDTTYVEAARVLAARSLSEGGRSDAGRLERAFRLVLARPPRAEESRILLAGLERHRIAYGKDRAAARRLLGAGEAPRPAGVDEAELAAWAAVCGVMLNLDEAVTRE